MSRHRGTGFFAKRELRGLSLGQRDKSQLGDTEVGGSGALALGRGSTAKMAFGNRSTASMAAAVCQPKRPSDWG